MSDIKGIASAEDFGSDFNAQSFLVWSILNQISTCKLVKVIAVTNAGGVSPVGMVDVKPLVMMRDGQGQAVDHDVLYKCPYFRIQGGSNAVILDPQIGDIGIMVFADNDISVVTKTKKEALPGSFRKFDMSDGLYIGGVLNGTPSQYVQFSTAGITVTSPVAVTVNAPNVTVNATTATIKAVSILLQNAGTALHTLINSTILTWLNNHVHNIIGATTDVPTTQPAPSVSTTVLQAE